MNRKTVLLSLFVFLGQFALQAAFIKGGSISYTCLGNNKYKVTARINRECSGPGITSYRMDVFNGLGTVAMSATRTSIKDISPLCSKQTLPCVSPNQVSSKGIEEHVYEATVDFSNSTYSMFFQNRNNNCQVYFSFETDGRDTAINTLSQGDFYINAMLDLCFAANACNSTPAYSGNAVVNLCCNQPFRYYATLNDAVDGDSLYYDTLAVRTSKTSAVVYASGYSVKYPVTPYCPPNPGVKNCNALPNALPPRGVYFSKSDGDFVFTPTVCTENSAIVFRAYEYRLIAGKRQLVGFSEKEVGLYVRICDENNSPYFIGTNKHAVCEGGKLCFNIETKDEPFLPKQTVPDTVNLTWDGGIPGATFTIIDPSAREKQAIFCWQTNIGDARSSSYFFSATAKDDFCNLPGIAARGYHITVKPKARSARQYTKSYKGRMIFEAIPISDTVAYKRKNYTYKFTIRDSSNSGVPIYMGYYGKDSFSFSKTGRYYIEHEINNPPYNCPSIYVDTFIVTQKHLTDIPSLTEQKVSIVPNPGHGVLSIVSDYMYLSGVTVRIYSMDGKMVSELHTDNSTIDVSGLKPGMYLFEVKGDNFYQHQRIVIDN